MLFSLEAVAAKEAIQLGLYSLTLLILWRFSSRRAGDTLLRVIVLFFAGETLDQSADVLVTFSRTIGSPPALLLLWHIYTRLVFLAWLAGIVLLLWSMLGDRLKMLLRNWLDSQIGSS